LLLESIAFALGSGYVSL